MSNDQPKTPITGRQNPALVEQHNAISAKLGLLTRDEAWAQKVCTNCLKPVNPNIDFNDRASYNEYFITAMCQGCQDALWAAFGEDE